MIKKLLSILVAIGLVAAFTMPAYAATSSGSSKCGDTQTQLIACNSKTGIGTINDLISIAVSVMTIVIGIVATGGLAYAGVIYASARDDQSQVGQARTIIRNIVIGLLLYALTIAAINWLIPGSVISGGTSDSTASPSVSPSASP